MSKAKELARKISEYIVRRHTSFYFGGVRNELHELLDLVLSEPDNPDELKGWIEVMQQGMKIIISVNKISYFYNGCIHFHGEDRMLVDESYEEIKQKIKEAS